MIFYDNIELAGLTMHARFRYQYGVSRMFSLFARSAFCEHENVKHPRQDPDIYVFIENRLHW
jgi:hypothetical protein